MTIASTPLRSTLIFRATPWSDRSVRRVFELAPTHTLADLHECLVDELALDDDHLWAFYLSGEWFDRTSEFDGSPDEGKAFDAEVGALGLEPGDAIAYLCDFGDEQRVDVELVGFGAADAALEQPRVLQREGEAADAEDELLEDEAFPEPEDELLEDEAPPEPEEEAPPPVPALPPAVAEELRAALAAWDPEAPDAAARIALDPARVAALASAVLDACPTAASLGDLGQSLEVRLDHWLADAYRLLATSGEPDAALRLAERIVSLTRTPQPLVLVGLAFAQAGRGEPAARALAAAERAELPLPQMTRLAIAQVRVVLRDDAGAEAVLRRLASCRWPSPRARPAAVAALATLLERTARTDEAQALLRSERARVEALAGVVRRSEPRVGRNDPCPCGSGKKSKACCRG
jgi:hypothetical protein